MRASVNRPRPPAPQRRSRLGCLGRLLLQLLVVLLTAEAVLQLGDWRPKGDVLVSDHAIGRRLAPNRDVVLWGGLTLTDARGLRVGPEPEPQRPPLSLSLGGSTSFGYGLDWHETYPAQLQQQLATRGQRLAVVNGAMPLGSSSNAVAFLHTLGEQIAPDLVIVSYGVNDLAVVNNPHQCTARGPIMSHELAPEERFLPIQDTRLVPVQEPGFKLPAFARNSYRRLGWALVASFGPWLKSELRVSAPARWLYRRDPQRFRDRLYLDPAAASHGFELYRANLVEVARWCRERGVALAFFAQPRKGHQDLFELLEPEARELTRAALALFREQGAAAALAGLEQVAARWPEAVMPRYNLAVALLETGQLEHAAPLVQELLTVRTVAHPILMSQLAAELEVPIAHPELWFEPRRGERLIMGDGMHPTARGNQLIARSLAELIDRQRLLDPAAEP